MENNKLKYDVAISFAGEDRDYAEELSGYLKKYGLRVFYDKYYKHQLWGKDLYQHLSHVYQKEARYCVIFISSAYASKLWTSHELKSAQARALSEVDKEYILPIRLDDTEIPGLPHTVSYIDFRKSSFEEIAQLLCNKLGLTIIKSNTRCYYLILDMNVKSGTEIRPEAYVKLNVGGLEIERTETGDGPIDAIFRAISNIVGTKSKLLNYKVKELTGYEALGEVSVTLQEGDHVAVGHGADTDLFLTSAKAYVDALNKLKNSFDSE